MVLKRLLVTTLGALGLGALVAGSAFGQTTPPAPGDGNIPAPDLFDDQIACSMNVPVLMGANSVPMPTMPPSGSMVSPLDELLRASMGMGDPQTIDATATGTGTYEDLIYIVPAAGNNCGSTTATAFTATANGAIATDVAEGYTAVKAAYDSLVTQEGIVASAQMTLNQARMAATATNPNTSAINSAQATLDAANEELAKRQTTLDAISAGPIYQAGIAEWRAMESVQTAVTNWNTAVTGVTDGSTGTLDILDATTYGGAPHQNAAGDVLQGYVALGTDPSGTDAGSVANVLNAADGSVNIANLRAYVGTGAETGDNFADDGSLLVPMRNTLDPGDGNAMEPTPTTATIAVIRADVEAANNVVKALEEAQAKNQNSLLDDIYTEGLRRARLEAAHLNAQWNAAITDAVDLRADNQKNRFDDTNGNGIQDPGEADNSAFVEAFSILSRYTAYGEALVKRDNAEAALRMAVADREGKTRATVNSFTSPGSFYQQLVDRRQALLDAQQNTVNRIVNAGGTPTTAQNQAVEDAEEALDDANKVKGDYDALVSDADNPAVGLVDELAKTGGDDGQALVSAITGNYDATQDNEGRLDELLVEDEAGMESGRIVDLENDVKGLMGGGGGVEDLRADLDALTAMDDPETMDVDETGAVTKNANDITSLDGRVADNERDLDKVYMDTYGMPRGVEAQHGDLAACDATGILNVANCADARSRHNEEDIEGINDKLMDKKEYIDNLAAEIGVDPVTGEGTDEDGMSRIDMNYAIANRADGQSKANAAEIGMDDDGMSRIDHNEKRSMDNAEDIDAEMKARMAEDTKIRGEFAMADNAVRGEFAAEDAAIRGEFAMADNAVRGEFAAEDAAIRGEFAMADNAVRGEFAVEDAAIRGEFAMADNAVRGEFAAEDAAIRGEFAMADNAVRGEFAAEDAAIRREFEMADSRLSSQLTGMINSNTGMINDNRSMIGALDTRLTNELETVRAGVAASMALAGMPAINGRGIAIGVGSYDGESAFAVGFQIQGEQASFKIGVTSSGGETGASAGVGFNF